MHLAGQPDAAQPRQSVAGKRGEDRLGRGNPVGRRLLRPAVMQARYGNRCLRLADDPLVLADQNGLDA